MSDHSSPIRSILVPLDGSELAAEALPLAVKIARQAGAGLRLALVHEHPAIPVDTGTAPSLAGLDRSTHKAERAYLRGVQARLREDGVRVASALPLTGTVGPALVTYVHDLGVDLVIMATHGRGGFRRIWLGSTADHLVRHLDIPVLLVRPASAGRLWDVPAATGRILVPLDGSPLAEEALGPAVELARTGGPELHLLRVVVPVVTSEHGFPVPRVYDEDLTTMARASAQAYLDGVAQQLGERGVRATGSAIIGWNIADTILDAAHTARVGMLAIATHGRGGLRRLMLGSVADKLLRAAEVPVLVVPAGRQGPAGSGSAKAVGSARRVRQKT